MPVEGDYELSYVETSGTCGALSNVVATDYSLREGSTPDRCEGGITEDLAACRVVQDEYCQVFDETGAHVAWAKDECVINLSADGSATGTCTKCFDEPDRTRICCSSYEVTYRPL